MRNAGLTKRLLSLCSALALVACTEPVSGPVGPDTSNNGQGLERVYPSASAPSNLYAPPDAQAEAFAVAFLNTMQKQSIEERREFCGYFFRTADGRIGATRPRRGTFASCDMGDYYANSGVFATYHTHGAFGVNYDNEVPSPQDLRSDFSGGLDGYVSTPGGRVWHVDFATRSTYQVCGLGCVYTDPFWQPQNEGAVRTRYTQSALDQRQL